MRRVQDQVGSYAVLQGGDQPHDLSPPPRTFADRIDRFFHITARGSDFKTEFRAGLVLFTTMCYIIVVNPDILSAAKLDKTAVASSTALCACVGSIVMGLFANLPFGTAPGMGLNTYFAYELVVQEHFTASQALAICMAAGGIFLFLGLTGLSNILVNNIPLSMKKAIVVGIGMFQTIVGLYSLGFIEPGTYTVLQLGSNIGTTDQLMGLFTILLISLLMLLEAPGSILIGIIASVGISLSAGFAPLPKAFVGAPDLELPTLDYSVLQTGKGWISVFFIFLVAFIDVGGVVLGIAAQSKELINEHGDVLGAQRAFITVGAGICMSSFCGTSPMIIFLESAAAVQQGGRTGFGAVLAGALFGLSMFFVPALSAVPRSATAPVLVLVGSFMMGAVMAIPWEKINHSLPAFITVCMITFTCSISYGLIAGLAFYFILNLPFVVAKIFNWRWLKKRLTIEEIIGTPIERQLEVEREIEAERQRTSVFMFKIDDQLLHDTERSLPLKIGRRFTEPIDPAGHAKHRISALSGV